MMRNKMTEENKTCDVCVYVGDGLDISGSTCYLCKRNPVDHRIDWFEERSDTKSFPAHVAMEPEYIVNADGSFKFTGFGLVRR